MRIQRVEIRRIHLPYVSPFETSGWREEGTHAVLVRIDADGITGWGESPVGPAPWYNEETSDTVMLMLRDILVPRLMSHDIQEPTDVQQIFAPVRANRMAQAGIEFAVWDWFGHARQQSLKQMLGGERDKVSVGVSVGIQSSIDALLKVVEGYVNAGYSRIKLKIKPGWDIEPTKAVREAWPNILLQVDANSIYTLDHAAHLAQLDDFGLLLIEQPLAHDDIFDHAKLQRVIRTPICLDESIVSPEHARWAIEMRACGVINIKPARVGGFAASKQIHDMAKAADIPVWCGGMLETGIGRAANVALASLPNFVLPGDISANARYYARDVVLNPFELNSDSTLTVPDAIGSGAQLDVDFIESITTQKLVITV
ncbi:MAG: o-succinylbenzoate synthase [Chloroflexota bacterium]|jgi:O-succinylbenzoate synthase